MLELRIKTFIQNAVSEMFDMSFCLTATISRGSVVCFFLLFNEKNVERQL